MSALPKTIRTIPQTRTPMPEQGPEERVHNFFEVALGYGMEAALREAERCLDCADPRCLKGCPVSVDIPGFVRRLTRKDYRGAYDLLARTNVLPAICGRVCPQEDQCEGVCQVAEKLEPVAIGRLERFLGDRALELGWSSAQPVAKNGFKVGIVGSGPAGIACAADLARLGCEVTVFEALHAPGGVLRYGIPEFRLPNAVIDAEMQKLTQLGVRIQCNTLVGRLFTLQDMLDEQGFHAVFIGTGAGLPKFMDIPGEGLNGVLSANELLTRCNLMQAGRFPDYDTPLGLGKRVAVIGAGNTAMDALRVSLRLGAEAVLCVYRRSRSECPARAEELHHAEQEGVEFHWLQAPLEILDDGHGNVRALRCQRMQLGEADASGRRRPEPVPGSEHELAVDTVVYAIGTQANPIIGQTSSIARNRWGYLQTDPALETSLAGVFAGGDIVTGSATVILAMGAGRRAAQSIARHLGIAEPAASEPGVHTAFGLDPGRRNFVRLRASEAPAPEAPHGALYPAALRALSPIERLRHAFPVLLVYEPESSAPAACSLRTLVDRAVLRLRAGADDPDALARCALDLEQNLRGLAHAAACEPRGGGALELSELGPAARRMQLEAAPTPAQREQTDRLARQVIEALPAGALVSCTRAGAQQLLEHLRQVLDAERASALSRELSALSAALYALEQTDFMTTHDAWAPSYLGAALGPAAEARFDLGALSGLLTPRRAAHSGETPRRARIAELRQALARAHVLSLPPSAWVFYSCEEAALALDTRLRELEALLTAAESAHLETRGPAAPVPAALQLARSTRRGARALLPPSLLLLDADRLEPREEERLLELLATDLPIKVLCTSAALAPPSTPERVRSHAAVPGGRAALLAALCRGLPDVHVLQAALALLPDMLPELRAALESPGPALFAVYTGEHDPLLPAYLAGAAACAARIFPTYVREAGSSQLQLAHNPEPQAAWPRAGFRAEDLQLQRVEREEPFTAAHLAACWPLLERELRLLSFPEWSEGQHSVAEALADEAHALDACVDVVDEQDRWLRARVSPAVLAYAERVAQHYRALQALALPAVEPPPPAAEPPPEPQPEAAETPPSAAAGGAYVETARCSSCDECVKRAPGLFSYDRDKRAVLRTPPDGSYRELVEAAEHCKLAIIHPGEPWDQSEPDLAELKERAAAFA